MNAALATTFLLLAPSAYAASTSQRQHHLAPDNECNLCSRNVTLLLATGRSGSTSLLEAINSLPGVALLDPAPAVVDAVVKQYVPKHACGSGGLHAITTGSPQAMARALWINHARRLEISRLT